MHLASGSLVRGSYGSISSREQVPLSLSPQFLHLQNGNKYRDQMSEEAVSLGWGYTGSWHKERQLLSHPPQSVYEANS